MKDSVEQQLADMAANEKDPEQKELLIRMACFKIVSDIFKKDGN